MAPAAPVWGLGLSYFLFCFGIKVPFHNYSLLSTIAAGGRQAHAKESPAEKPGGLGGGSSLFRQRSDCSANPIRFDSSAFSRQIQI